MSASSSHSQASELLSQHSFAQPAEDVIDLTQEPDAPPPEGGKDDKEPPEKKRKVALVDDEAKASSAKGSRHFCFTLQCKTQAEAVDWAKTQDISWRANPRIARFAMQVEKGKEGGNIHVQGYVGLTNKTTMTFNAFKSKVLGGKPAHIEKAHSPVDAFKYCQKADTRLEGPWVYGEAPAQGDRTDLKQFVEDAKAKMSLAELQEKHYSVEARYTRYFDRVVLRSKSETGRTEITKVMILWGAAGTGKTTRVRAFVEEKLDLRFDDAVYCPVVPSKKGPLWWDGYDGHPVVFIDEFDPSSFDFNMFKKLAGNKEAIKVQVKGGSVHFKAKWLILTSNFNPRGWWGLDKDQDNARKDAFSRRVDVATWYRLGPKGQADIREAWMDPELVEEKIPFEF